MFFREDYVTDCAETGFYVFFTNPYMTGQLQEHLLYLT